MERRGTSFKLEMIESKIHVLWASQMQSKEVSHFVGASGMRVISEDEGWIATSFPPTALEKYSLLDHGSIYTNITMATFDMKNNISLDISASDDLTFSTAVVISIVCAHE